VAFNTAEGWSRDVTMDIADELRRRYVDFGEVWRPQVETPQMIRAPLMSAIPLTAARKRTSPEMSKAGDSAPQSPRSTYGSQTIPEQA
jgi:hypothetical protein